jgi:hypothetical protein
MEYDETGVPHVRVRLGADNITITGNVNLVDNVRVNNTEAQSIPVYIRGNVIAVTQNTSPWVISANASVNSNSNPIYVNFTNSTIQLSAGSATIGNVGLNTGNNVIGNVRLESGNNIIGNVRLEGNLAGITGNIAGVTGNIAGITSNVAVTQATSPWVVSGNSSVNSSTNPIFVNLTNTEIEIKNDSGNALPISANTSVNSSNNPIYVSGVITGGTTQVTFPDSSLAAFEEIMVTEPVPVIQLEASYGYQTENVSEVQTGTGSTGVDDILFYANSGTTTGSQASIRSRRFLRYRPGTGSLARFTAMFTSDEITKHGVDGVQQLAGMINSGNAYGFGFSGLTGLQGGTGPDQRQFGILHRYGGRAEIRTLTINTAPTGNQTVTITLNGTAYAVSVTSGTASECAQQIALGNTYGGLWLTDQVDGTVIFTGAQTGVRAGSYSMSSTGSGTLATGTFTTNATGVANTNVWKYQSQWDNPITSIDPSKLNVYAIDMRWLGAGIVRFFIEHPTTGKMTLVHTQHWANGNTIAHVNMPSFRIGYAAGVLAGQTPSQAAIVKGASIYGGVQGRIAATAYSEGWYAVETTTKAKDIIHHLISVKNPYTKNNKNNTREFVVQDLSVSIQGSDPAVIMVFINPTIDTGKVLFDTIPQSNAIVSTSPAPTFSTTVNNPVVNFVVGINGTQQFDLLPYRLVLGPGDFISVAILSGQQITRTVTSLTWSTD